MAGRVPFSPDDLSRLARDYRAYVEAGRLDVLASEMGRSKSVLCEKARRLGLTDALAARKSSGDKVGDQRRGKPLGWDHPKGMLGKRHTVDTREQLRVSSREYRASLSDDQVAGIADKMLRSRFASQGSLAPNHKAGSWKAGWRVIGGNRKYYRSRWEANYARYLNWLQHRGDILDWKHESETFWFEGIKRGVRSYLPDFRVWEADGSSKIHEVKGWMDARSRTTLKRMAKYHPEQTIIVIAEKQYREIERRLGALIEGWE